ncbi:hypothetical protein [Microbispora sp. NPDC046933]|uniref:hypothetical protein n=1 Tax=Microbispora sp. NPDC046933 TaxID=3155618 RepID=UPI0033E142ED
MENEPEVMVAAMLSQIITQVKQSRPTRTDGSGTTQGFVFSQQVPGRPVSPRDYGLPWHPAGGTPGQPGAPTTESVKRAMAAASNTAELVDSLLVVTDDGTLVSYSGGGRKLTVAYQGILQAMEAEQAPARSPQIEARVAEARKVLWTPDRDPTPLYKRYLENQKAYSDATSAFVVAQNRILADPAQRDSWPVLAAPFQTDVDQAFDKWKAQGADEVEAALATVESLGIPMEQGMIAAARRRMEAWSLALTGIVAVKTPYSRVMPSEWAMSDVDDTGWTHLKIETREYHQHFEQHGHGLSTGEWRGDSSASGGDAGISIFGFGFHGRHDEHNASGSAGFSNQGSDGTTFTSDASNLTIELQYALLTIERPWLTTDLFRMRSWYLRGEREKTISDGTISGQVNTEKPFLPMIPTHLLAVRNVRVTAENWGTVATTLSSWWSRHESQYSTSGSSSGGGIRIPVLGPLSLDAGGYHSEDHHQSSFKDENGNDHSADFGARFNGQTLEINGTQIVAWLSEIIPLSPPKADPSLPPEQ